MSIPEKNQSSSNDSQNRPASADGNAKLAGAKEALKDKLLKAVLQQAVQELGSPDDIAQSLLEQASKSPEIDNATRSLITLVNAEIELRSLNGFNDSDAAANSIFEKIRERDSVIPETVEAIRARLIGEIYSRSMESVADQDALSTEVYSSLESREESVDEAVSRVRSRLLEEITSRAAESVSDFDAVAAEISGKLGNDTTIVEPILNEIRSLMMSRISDRAVSALSDADQVARSIADSIRDSDDVIVKAVDALHKKLLGNVETAAFEKVKNPDTVVDEITAGFDATPAEVAAGIEKLHDKLVSDIRDGALDSISDSTSAASEARSTIADDDSRISSVRDTLKANLLEEVTNSAISELSNHVHSSDTLDISSVDLSEITAVSSAPTMNSVPTERISSHQDAQPEPVEEDSFSDQTWSDSIDDATTADEAPQDSVEAHEADFIDQRSLEQPFESQLSMPVADPEPSSADSVPVQETVSQPVDEVVEVQKSGAGHNGSEGACYVYGIVSDSEVAGAELPSSGITSDSPVEQVSFGGLTAFISNVSMEDFSGPGFKARLQDKDWLKEKVRLHSHVLDTISEGRTVIPMRFCTVYRSDEEVSQLLSTNRDHYQQVLEKISGKREWSVKVYRDEARLAERVAQSDREVEDSLGSISRGVVHFVKEEMNRLNQIGGEQAIELMSQHCSSRSHAALMDCAADGFFKPTLGDNGQESSDVVLNAAYLVSVEDEAKIRDEVDRLGSEYSELGFRFELHGPWPPYHFASEPKAQKVQAVTA